MRIAPNNQYPASHFIEVYSDGKYTNQQDQIKNPNWECVTVLKIKELKTEITSTLNRKNLYTVCLFRIRPNQVPTLHNFKQK